eukprot:6235602-Karenia_brevis.AAC.1
MGAALKRPRRMAQLANKAKCPMEYNKEIVSAKFQKLFVRDADFSWEAYFENIISEEDVQKDIQWAQNRKDVKQRWSELNILRTCETLPVGAQTWVYYPDDPEGSHLAALTINERQRLVGYDMLFKGEAADLNQDPLHLPLKSSNGSLPTCTKGMGITFSMKHRTFLSPKQHAVAMGFPITQRQVEVSGAHCVFSEAVPAPKKRSRRSMINAIGNSMSVPCI